MAAFGNMVPVSSSMIRAVGYDQGKLYVEFSGGATWEYDAPLDMYEGLIGAGSAGSFFHNNVKNAFDGRQV